jgi:hypothetical protein
LAFGHNTNSVTPVNDRQKKKRPADHEERSFGLWVGGTLCFIAGLLVWRSRVARAEAIGALGGALIVFALVAPAALRRPRVWWFRLARALGYVNARIILTLVFALVFVPLSLLWRLTGKDPLSRRRRRFEGWTPYPAARHDRTHYARMY